MTDREELYSILSQMEIPPDRFDDLAWLGRNLGIRNGSHPLFKQACDLIRKITKENVMQTATTLQSQRKFTRSRDITSKVIDGAVATGMGVLGVCGIAIGGLMFVGPFDFLLILAGLGMIFLGTACIAMSIETVLEMF
jgi:hypothetical protein